MEQSSGDAMTERFHLGRFTTAFESGDNIIAFSVIGDLKRFGDLVGLECVTKVVIRSHGIHSHLASAGGNPYSGNCCFFLFPVA